MAEEQNGQGTEKPVDLTVTILEWKNKYIQQTKLTAKAEKELATQTKVVEDLRKELAQLRTDLEKTSAKLEAAKSAPVGDVVYLGGKSYPIMAVVRADQNFEQVKRGHVHEGLSMAVIDKQF